MRTLILCLALLGCNDTNTPDPDDEQEVITTVVLTFTPSEGGDPVVARWADPEQDGDPAIDDIELVLGTDYSLDVEFLDEASTPAEDITEEVKEEGDEHQVFITGNAIAGPATLATADVPLTHAYDDTDGNGNPIGLENSIEATEAGSGVVTITLRHLPEQDGTPIKTADLASEVASSGFGTLPGDNDVQVSFNATVQ
ncbi:MAG: hypothetical protein AB8H79_05180 [Myxococcota bacterium]